METAGIIGIIWGAGCRVIGFGFGGQGLGFSGLGFRGERFRVKGYKS